MSKSSNDARVINHLVHNALMTVAVGLVLAAYVVLVLVWHDLPALRDLLPIGDLRYELEILNESPRSR